MSNTESPFFSIIIPTYNRAHLISLTVKSVLSQNFESYEIIIVDDGSTDNTDQIIKNFTDKRLHYFKKQNAERGAARNYGWQKAKGKYITFLDSDDLIYPFHLQTALDEIKKLNYPECVSQAFEIKDHETGKILSPGYKAKNKLINIEIFKGNFLACFGVFIKTDVFAEIRFEEERKLAGSEDWLFWLQLSARYPFYFNNKVTGSLIQHSERSVHFFDEESLLFRPEFIKAQLENDPVFVKRFGVRGIQRAYSHVLTYAALYLAAAKKKKQAISYLMRALRVHPAELLDIRTMAIIKKIVFH